MTDRYPSAYQKALDKNREDDKKTEKRRKFKVKVKGYFQNPMRIPEKTDPDVRTGGQWKRPPLRERLRMPSRGERPLSVVKITQELQKFEDTSLTEQKRRDALEKAENIIMHDYKLSEIANNVDPGVFGGGRHQSAKEQRKAESFVSKHLRKYPGANENRQYNHTIARFMIAKNRHYYDVVKNNGALRDYESMRRKYGK